MHLYRKVKYYLLLIIFILSFTSCIELVEEITVNEKKDGSVKLSVNFGELSFLTGMLNSYFSGEEMKAISSQPSKCAASINSCTGIENVQSKDFDPSSLAPELSFDFTNGKNLNQAYYKLLMAEKKWFHPDLFKVKKNKIKRRNIGGIISKLIKNHEGSFVGALHYIDLKTVVNLPSEAKQIKGSNFTTQKNGKQITFKTNMNDLVKGNTGTDFVIKY